MGQLLQLGGKSCAGGGPREEESVPAGEARRCTLEVIEWKYKLLEVLEVLVAGWQRKNVVCGVGGERVYEDKNIVHLQGSEGEDAGMRAYNLQCAASG